METCMKSLEKILAEDRFFDPDPAIRSVAVELYQEAADVPIVSPHGHVDPRLFADPKATFGSPADLFIIPDHYVFRMLYSQGATLEALGVPRQDGGLVEKDHRKIWRTFCENFYLFRGTPSGIWLTDELASVFGITEKPGASNADRLFDLISEKLASPDFSPRRLFERFDIEVLCTTDPATDTLQSHQAIRQSGWNGRIVPTFRPDAVVNFDAPSWRANIDKLGEVSNIQVVDYKSYIRALEQRREFFKSMGATATDHAALIPATAELTSIEAEEIFQTALR